MEMPINRLLRDSKLGPEKIERLNRAFAHALDSMSLVDRNDPLTELIAKQIIEVGADGDRDPTEIAEIACKQLGVSPAHAR